MCSSEVPDSEGVSAALDRFRASCAELAALPMDALSTPERFAVLQGIETGRRQLPAAEHQAINAIIAVATPAEIGGAPHAVLAQRLRISPAEARRRIRDAAVLGPRTSMTGQPLAPRWPATAAAQAAGAIGVDHVREIRRFFTQLPAAVDEPTRAHAEAQLAGHASRLRPDELRQVASPPTSTPTAPSATPTGPANAGSASGAKTSTA